MRVSPKFKHLKYRLSRVEKFLNSFQSEKFPLNFSPELRLSTPRFPIQNSLIFLVLIFFQIYFTVHIFNFPLFPRLGFMFKSKSLILNFSVSCLLSIKKLFCFFWCRWKRYTLNFTKSTPNSRCLFFSLNF